MRETAGTAREKRENFESVPVQHAQHCGRGEREGAEVYLGEKRREESCTGRRRRNLTTEKNPDGTHKRWTFHVQGRVVDERDLKADARQSVRRAEVRALHRMDED